MKHNIDVGNALNTLWPQSQSIPAGWTIARFDTLATLVRRRHVLVSDVEYRVLGMRWYAKGPYIKETLPRSSIKARHLFQVRLGDFVYNRLFAWKGSFGVIEQDCTDAFASGEFPMFTTSEPFDAYYLWMLFLQPWVWLSIEQRSSGSTSNSRLRLREDDLEAMLIPIPPPGIRKAMVDLMQQRRGQIISARRAAEDQLSAIEALSLAAIREAFYGYA